MDLRSEIARIRAERGAAILAHSYQRREVQEVADHVGDSLELARLARQLPHPVIVLAGVRFMAEVAKLLAPEKRVLHPVPEAGCPLADSITPEGLRALKERHPGVPVVAYVNTSVEVKALSDVICTSRNAPQIARAVAREGRVILVPDENLARWVARETGLEVISWPGHCYVHSQMSLRDLEASLAEHPRARVLVHPECPPELQARAHSVVSTGIMVREARESRGREFIVGTEYGLIERLRREEPQNRYWPLGVARICHNMKKIGLWEVYMALRNLAPAVEIPPETAGPARRAVERMFHIMDSIGARAR